MLVNLTDLTIRRWLAWFCDSLDFFSVSVSVNELSATFDNRPTHEIVRCLPISTLRLMLTQSFLIKTTAITLTLLVRPIGAVRRDVIPALLVICSLFCRPYSVSCPTAMDASGLWS